jgi:hypothetical protein
LSLPGTTFALTDSGQGEHALQHDPIGLNQSDRMVVL